MSVEEVSAMILSVTMYYGIYPLKKSLSRRSAEKITW